MRPFKKNSAPLTDEQAEQEWNSDGPLAVEIGPWAQASPDTTRMWGHFDADGAMRIYRALSVQTANQVSVEPTEIQ